MISARAVAVQGLGYGALLTSAQGFIGVAEFVHDSTAIGPPRFLVHTRRRDDDEELLLILTVALQVIGRNA